MESLMVKNLLIFSVYTLAMIGVIVIAFVVWRNTVAGANLGKKGTIKVEESLSLNARKTLYVIKIKDERFLIAADVDKTTFLAKLNDGESLSNRHPEQREGSQGRCDSSVLPQNDALRSLEQTPIMRNILKELAKNTDDD